MCNGVYSVNGSGGREVYHSNRVGKIWRMRPTSGIIYFSGCVLFIWNKTQIDCSDSRSITVRPNEYFHSNPGTFFEEIEIPLARKPNGFTSSPNFLAMVSRLTLKTILYILPQYKYKIYVYNVCATHWTKKPYAFIIWNMLISDQEATGIIIRRVWWFPYQ
jgi:hypothetical protein